MNQRAIASWVYLASTAGCGLVLITLIPRLLSTADAGLWFTLQATSAFVSLSEIGIGYVLMREVACNTGIDNKAPGSKSLVEAYSTEDRKKIRVLLAIVMSIAVATSIGFGVYFWLVVGDGSQRRPLFAWFIYAAAIVLQLIVFPQKSHLEGVGKLHWEKYASSMAHVLGSVLILVAAFLYRDPLYMSIGYCIGSASLVFILCRKSSSMIETSEDKPLLRGEWWEILRSGLGVAWVNIGATATKSSFAPIVTGILSSAALAPLFFATKIFSIASTAINVLITSERAIVANLHGSERIEELRKKVKVALLKNLFLSLGIGVLLVAVGIYAVPIFIGPDYVLEPWAYVVLSVDLLLNNFSAACAIYVMACGKNPFKYSVPASGLVTVVALFGLVPVWGILGAALAPVIAGCVTSYWFNLYALRKYVFGGRGPSANSI